jgi:hypothetical protein
MLCKDCGEFFESSGEKWRRKYLDLKRKAVHDLKSDPRTSEMPQLRNFELDLEIFQVALDLRADSKLPVPGIKGIYHGFRRNLKERMWKSKYGNREDDAMISPCGQAQDVNCVLCFAP